MSTCTTLAKMNAGRRHPCIIGMLILLLAAIGGCESLVPRDDLQAIARTLPPGEHVSAVQRDAIAAAIREETGVEAFEFSDFAFADETRLPSGTGWIIGLFLGGADRP